MIETLALESLKETGSSKLLDLAKDIPGKSMDVAELDKPILINQETRKELPPLSNETRERLEQKGYGENTLDAIGSEAEVVIYEGANLEPSVINGKECLIKTDIDYNQKDIDGKTNLERMNEGRAPRGSDGKPIELHHIGQKPDSPLAELTRKEHTGNGNDNVLHDKIKESEIDREGFDKERSDYWKSRADALANANRG